MDLKLVYRALYRISVWTVDGFFYDVHVEGRENVPANGPVIIAATHPNEIIDAATIATTLPNGRIVSFWAKSTFFRHPISRWIFESSNCIPVYRNPSRDDGSSKAALFRSSSEALASGATLGVFPEGACYTEPTIVQILSGTAWAAVEYERWQRKQEEDGKAFNGHVTVIPLALVYTERATFDSSIYVHYGEPIPLAQYSSELFDVPANTEPDAVAYGVVQKITRRIEEQLFSTTINASDWETLYAAETLRAVVRGDVPTKDWVKVSQHFVDVLSDANPSEPLRRMKESLIRYYSLLHYTGLRHRDLVSLPPSPSVLRCIFNLVPSASTVLLLPLYIPALLLHIPACISGELMIELVATKHEPEGFGQYRSVGGGIGVGTAITGLLAMFGDRLGIWAWTTIGDASVLTRGGRDAPLSAKALAYLGAGWLMARVYALLAPGLHRRLKNALSAYRILAGVMSHQLMGQNIAPYTKIPPPTRSNAFIRRHGDTAKDYWDKKEREMEIGVKKAPARIAGRRLVRATLNQRVEVQKAVEDIQRATII